MAWLSQIWRLGLKELRSLWADQVMLALIVWAFTGAIYSAAMGASQELRLAPVAVVDEDRSPLSQRLIDSLTPPWFKPPRLIALAELDREMDQGRVSFAVWIPAHFERDLAAGRQPVIQVNIDATHMSQSFIGAGYISAIFSAELGEQLDPGRNAQAPVRLVTRVRYNPNLSGYWFGGMLEAINMVNVLTIILVGAALIREREHGTLEHLLVMPLSAPQILLAKIWANGLVVLLGTCVALLGIVRGLLGVPIAGSIPLFLAGSALYLFSAASIGILLATFARSMPQFGLLFFLTEIPLQMLSGGMTPRESMPELLQQLMLAVPSTYFVRLAQGILYRGAGLSQVWPDLLAIAATGAVFFALALARFRRSVTLTRL